MALSKILPASQEQYAGARNLVINGACTISQRGTSQTGITTDGYKQAPDRFNLNVNGAGTWTASQSTTAPEGFSNSYKVECTTADASLAAGDVMRFRYRMEGQDLQHLKKGTSNAESVTLSFYVRSSKTGTYTVELNDADNSRHIVKSYNIASADTWQFVSLTYAGDTTGVFDNDNALSLSIMFCLAAGSNFTSGTLATSWASITAANRSVGQVNLADTVGNTFYLTGVQLEVGEQATPFEHRSYADELARCYRYYYRHADGGDTSTASVGTGTQFSATAIMCAVSFPVRMRATPTLDHLNATDAYRIWRNGGSDYFNNFNAFYDAHPLGGAMQADNNISGTSGQGGRVVLGGSSAYIAFDAEL